MGIFLAFFILLCIIGVVVILKVGLFFKVIMCNYTYNLYIVNYNIEQLCTAVIVIYFLYKKQHLCSVYQHVNDVIVMTQCNYCNTFSVSIFLNNFMITYYDDENVDIP